MVDSGASLGRASGGSACIRSPRAASTIAWLGRLGFATKALVYGVLGGLLMRSAVSGVQDDASPQGVFVLVAGLPVGDALLATITAGVLAYAGWRVCEGLLGVGSSSRLSAAGNAFRFRVSPLVSAAVYIGYAAFVIKLLLRQDPGAGPQPLDLHPAAAFFLAAAFLAAFVSQAVHVVTGQFLQELKPVVLADARVRRTASAVGRIGFAARAVVFMLVSVLFWKVLTGTLGDDDDDDDDGKRSGEQIVSRALNVLLGNAAGRVWLFITGAGLLVYAAFAFWCVAIRAFPTQPPVFYRELPVDTPPHDVRVGELEVARAGAPPAADDAALHAGAGHDKDDCVAREQLHGRSGSDGTGGQWDALLRDAASGTDSVPLQGGTHAADGSVAVAGGQRTEGGVVAGFHA